MPGRTKSDAKKRQIYVTTVNKWMEKGVEMYQNLQQDSTSSTRTHGLGYVCSQMEDMCWKEDKVVIKLSKQTLSRRLQGVPSQAASNAQKSWLTNTEADALIEYSVQLGNNGWPFSRVRLQEHAIEICQGRYGIDFPGLGHNWADRFLLKHSDRLKPSWSRPLDDQRARGANPSSKAEYFGVLETVIEGEGGEDRIVAESMYGVDETGVQQGLGTKERVYGNPAKTFQHQKRSGGRENITVIATICADGTALVPPAVIYKAETYHTSWKQKNPLNAS
jgi:hypothetical protein